jgi:O-antigen ligase
VTHSPLVAAVVPYALVAVILILRDPLRIGLPAFAASIPFGQMLAIGNSAFLSLSSIFGLLLAVGLLLERLRVRQAMAPLSPTVGIWLLFVGVVGSTTIWSISQVQTRIGFIIIASLVAIFALVSMSDVDAKALRRTENGLLLGGVLVVVVALYQYFVQGGFPGETVSLGPQPDGRFGNGLLGPDNQAVAFMLPLVIALTRVVSEREHRQRVLHGVIAAMLVAGVLATGSRGGLLAAGVAVIVLASSLPVGRTKLVAYGLIALTAAAVVFFTNPGGIAARTGTTTSSSGRTDIWRVAAAACPQYCPYGSGWETFPDVYQETQASVPDARVLVGAGTYQAHDVWILIAIELGLPGLLLFAAAMFFTTLDASHLSPRLRGPPLAGFMATLFAAFFLSNAEYKFFWMALIYVALSRNFDSGRRLAAKQSQHRRAATVKENVDA